MRSSTRQLSVFSGLLFALVLTGSSLHAQTTDQTISMDCGSLWVEGADARIRTTVTQVFPHKGPGTVSLRIPGDSFGTSGPNTAFSATVYRCLPGETAGDLIPIASEMNTNQFQPAEIRFLLPEDHVPFEEVRYHIYLARTDIFGNQKTEVFDHTRPWFPNQVINPRFEHVDPADPTNPYGWYLDGERQEGSFKTTTERRGGKGGVGSPFVRLQTVGPTKGNTTPAVPRVSAAERIPVSPGTMLQLSTDAWIRSASGRGIRVEVRFRDEKGARIGTNFILESEAGLTTDSYRAFHAWGVVPEGASTAQLILTTGGSVGVTDVRSVTLSPAGMEKGSTAIIKERMLEEGARIAKPLYLAKGGKTRLFDFGPAQQRVASSFTPLHGGDVWGPDKSGGWLSESQPQEFSGQLPEALSSDGVLLEDAPLRLQSDPGKAWVWLLLGSPGDAGIHGAIADSISIEGQSFPIPGIPYAPIQYHLSRDDDAVNELRTQQQSIFNSYILPRYTQLIVEIDSPNDAIEIACQKGQRCPLVAAGIFQGVDETTVNKAVLGFHEKRRQSFDARWAKAAPTQALKVDLPVSKNETERGFLPFIPTPGVPIRPHDVPSREMVTSAMNGVTIQVAPGSRALFRLGVYPLKFRRQGQLSMSEPISQLGEPIQGADWQIRATRYRAFRDDPKGSEYRLAPDIVVQEESLSIRPGITRTIWVDSEIPENAQAGEYVGAMRLQAGRNRYVEIPIRVEVLPFPLPVPIHGHGTSTGQVEQLDYQILRHVNALSVPLRAESPDQLIPSMEALVNRLTELGNSIERIFLTPEVPLDPAAIDDWVSMLGILRETGQSRGWPQMSLVASAFRQVGLDSTHLKQLCSKERWNCASVSSSTRPRRRDRTEEIQWLTESALTASQIQRTQSGKSQKGNRESWLFNVGCGRAGKGVLSWALGLSGSICVSGDSIRKDPLDAWASTSNTFPIDHLFFQGRNLETERFLFSQQGLLDARYLNLMERIIDKGRKDLPSQLIRKLRGFLRTTKKSVVSRSQWVWKDGISQVWPVDERFRKDMVALIKEAWDALQNQSK